MIVKPASVKCDAAVAAGARIIIWIAGELTSARGEHKRGCAARVEIGQLFYQARLLIILVVDVC
jgi:hypothetical protein